MSADNWTECPQCVREIDRAFQADETLLASAYGILPLDEFDALRERVSSGPVYKSSLREDYEFWLEGFELNISYKCSCKECGLSFHHREVVTVPETSK